MALINIKLVLTMAIAMTITVALFRSSIVRTQDSEETTPFQQPINKEFGNKRVSRFLAEKLPNNPRSRNPNAADHCNKDESVCGGMGSGKNSTMACCNNKCVDLIGDDNNCGACKNKCKFTQSCCRGECVYLAYDKRHCGECNNGCRNGEYCVYGMCSYA